MLSNIISGSFETSSTMLVGLLLTLTFLVTFIFLPQLVTVLKLPITTPNDTLSNTLRLLLNFRYYAISKVLFFRAPQKAGKIEQLFVYPLKSVSHISPTRWEIDQHGLKHDRQYMLGFWDSKANCYQGYTMRNVPRLSLVEIDYNLEENWFKFSYPTADGTSKSSFKLPCNVTKEFLKENAIDEEQYKTDLWGIKFESINIGKALPQDFIDSMGMKREGTTLLVSAQGKFVKTSHPKDLEEMRKVLFQDYYPIHLLAQRTVNELNQRIKDTGNERVVEPLQFRPNVVIGGNQIELDFWYDISINGHRWLVVQKTPRCSIGNVRLDKGDFDKSNIVTRTLRQYRRIDPGDKNGSFLGDYAIHYDSGYTIGVGDEFYLKQQKISTYLPLS